MMTVNEAAGYLRVSNKALYAWAGQKRIPFIKVGSAVRFSPAMLDKWLKARTVVPRMMEAA